MDHIGGSIRSLRKSRGMTLQQLSSATGLSTGYLSNIERDVTSPTLLNIQKICEALDSSLGDLLARNSEEKIVIRKEDIEITIDEENNLKLETIDFGKGNASFLYLTVPAGSSSQGSWWTHKYNEVGTVISGELTIVIEDKEFDLKVGDSIYIEAHTKHCFFNKSKTETSVSYWSKIWDGEEKNNVRK